jgi:hypothetical protein
VPKTPMPSRRTILATLSLPVLPAVSVATAPATSAATTAKIPIDFTK